MFMNNVVNSYLRKVSPLQVVRCSWSIGNILLNCECNNYCGNVNRKFERKIYSAVKVSYCSNKYAMFLPSSVFCRTLCTGQVKSEGKVVEGENEEKRIEDAELQEILKDIGRDFQTTEDNLHENPNPSNLDKNGNNNRTGNKNGKVQSNYADKICSSKNQTTHQKPMKSKYKEFSDEDSVVIHSIEEEEQGLLNESKEYFSIYEEKQNRLHSSILKRGETGVFDLAELVDILREENLQDISVIKVPLHIRYADYLVITRAKSPRHSVAVTEYILKLYKMKKNKNDKFLKVEGGEKNSKWKAIDMGNIVLHIFLEEMRECYDIETLWLVDSTYDREQHEKKDPVMDILQEHMEYLNSLQPSAASKTA